MSSIADRNLARGRLARRSPVILRLALRDLRNGLRGFGIFLACIAIGVAAIVGVGSVSHGLSDGLAREGRRILGGDLSFSLIHRQLSPAERQWVAAYGSISTVANLRAMARGPTGEATLVEAKAVGPDYPTIGHAVLDPPGPLSAALAEKDGVSGLVADEALAVRLNLKVGDPIVIGEAHFVLRAILTSEPDKLAAGIGFGPRVIFSQAALTATRLLQPGGLVRWTSRLAVHTDDGRPASDAAVARIAAAAHKAFPDAGWQIRTRDNVSPQFSKNLVHFTEFLTLVGLTALIVGGVGVANAVRVFVERKQADLATLKSLGATGGRVFTLALSEVMLIAALGIVLGLVSGAALPFAVEAFFGALIPFPFVPSVYPGELAAGVLYGALTALAFSLAPLGRVHDVPVSALFREHVEERRSFPRRRYLVMTLAAGLAFAGAVLALSADRRLALIYMGVTFVGFLMLRAVAVGIMALARRLPRPRRTELRLALANIHRPGALTPAVVLSLGLGLALLVTLTLIDGNIRGQLARTLPGRTPSFFFLDVQSGKAAEFTAFLKQHAPGAKIEEVPMMRGRVLALAGRPVDKIKASEDVAWVLEGDRGITYADKVPEGSKLEKGKWWSADYHGPPLVSVDEGIARGLGLGVGDSIKLNVLGRVIEARIANLRKVDWRTLGINFVFVFSPDTFAGAPHTMLATVTFPKGGDSAKELRLLRDVAVAYPAVTSLRVKDALETIESVVGQLATAIRGASAIALATSVLVLAGALAAGQRARLYDAVVLKTLGATRRRLLVALIVEYAALGLVTGLFGVLAGEAAAWGIVTRVMKLDGYHFLWSSAVAAVALALVVTVLLGLAGTWRVLGQKPAPYLRDL